MKFSKETKYLYSLLDTKDENSKGSTLEAIQKLTKQIPGHILDTEKEYHLNAFSLSQSSNFQSTLQRVANKANFYNQASKCTLDEQFTSTLSLFEPTTIEMFWLESYATRKLLSKYELSL